MYAYVYADTLEIRRFLSPTLSSSTAAEEANKGQREPGSRPSSTGRRLSRAEEEEVRCIFRSSSIVCVP